MAIFMSPTVSMREIDLSDVIANVATAIGGIVVRSKRGPLDIRLISSTRKYKENYCLNTRTIDKSVIEGYAAVSYLEYKGASLLVKRAVSDTVKFGGAVFAVPGSAENNASLTAGVALNADKSGPGTYSFGSDECVVFLGADPGAWNNNLRIKITEHDTVEKTFVVEVYEIVENNTLLRVKQKASREPDARDGYGRSLYIENVFKENAYVTVINNPTVPGMPKLQSTALSFAGGSDGGTITVGEVITAWESFKNVDDVDVSLLIQGGFGDETLQVYLAGIANARKDCVAIIDAPEDITEVTALVNWRKIDLAVDSSYTFLVAPWLYVYDWDNDEKRYVPPSGVVAGLAARNDFYMHPWYAFAGVNRGVVEILGLKAYYDKDERDALSPAGINVFKKKPGQFVLWDNKTLQVKESALSYIEIRRLLIVLEKSIANMAESILFEPLTDATRMRFVAVINDYLRTVRANQGLYDYKIVCDKIGDPNGNNPPRNVDIGQLNCDIYLKPVHAIRYIQLSAIVMRHGASFEEKVTLTV